MVVPAGLTMSYGKQPRSSLSRVGSVASGKLDALQLPPNELTALQYSKWPISSENATLYECAAHSTRVAGVDVLNIGWNAYGCMVQVLAPGWKSPSAKPFAMLAVIEPVSPVVTSWMSTWKPAGVSCILTVNWSPLLNSSVSAVTIA